MRKWCHTVCIISNIIRGLLRHCHLRCVSVSTVSASMYQVKASAASSSSMNPSQSSSTSLYLNGRDILWIVIITSSVATYPEGASQAFVVIVENCWPSPSPSMYQVCISMASSSMSPSQSLSRESHLRVHQDNCGIKWCNPCHPRRSRWAESTIVRCIFSSISINIEIQIPRGRINSVIILYCHRIVIDGVALFIGCWVYGIISIITVTLLVVSIG